MRGITKEFPGVKALKDVIVLGPPRRDPCPRRRERRRQVDPDEGRSRASTRTARTTVRSSTRATSAASTTSTRASGWGSSSSTRSSRWSPTSRSPRTSSWPTSRRPAGSSSGARRTCGRASCSRRSGSTSRRTPLVRRLGVGKQQLVEIAKALSKKVDLLILDEPTSQPQRGRQPEAAQPPPRVPVAGHRLRPDLAQAQGSRGGRRHDHGPARRRGHRVARRQGRRRDRGPDHPRHGRARPDPPLPAARGGDRRRRVRGQELEGRAIRSTTTGWSSTTSASTSARARSSASPA